MSMYGRHIGKMVHRRVGFNIRESICTTLASSTKDKFGIKMTTNSHSITFHYFVSTYLGNSTLFSAICCTLSKRDSATKPKQPPTPPKSDVPKLYTLIGQPGNLVCLKTEIEQGEAKWKIGLAHRSTRASSHSLPFKFRGTLMQRPPSGRRRNYQRHRQMPHKDSRTRN